MFKLKNKKIKHLCIVLATVVAASAVVVWHYVPQRPSASEFRHISQDSLQVGDIIFRRGQSLASRIVLTADVEGNYSHIGMVVHINGKNMALHAVPSNQELPQRIKLESIEDYFAINLAQRGAICRLALSPSKQQVLNSAALSLYSQGVEFDNDYNMADSSKLYCTELIWHLYKNIGIDITQGKSTKLNLGFFDHNIILPSHIYEYPHMRVVLSF